MKIYYKDKENIISVISEITELIATERNWIEIEQKILDCEEINPIKLNLIIDKIIECNDRLFNYTEDYLDTLYTN